MNRTRLADGGSASSGSPSLPCVALHIVRGHAREKTRTVNTPAFLIGSASDCDLVLGDPQFPKLYAYLLVRVGSVSVRHLGFTPELTVNGRAVTRAALDDGDRLRLGPYEFIVRIQERSESSERVQSPFGYLHIGTRHARKPDTDAFTVAGQLIDDVRKAVDSDPSAIPLVPPKKSRPIAAGPELAAS